MIPVWLVNRMIYPLHERLKGKPTHDRLRELERTQWLGPEALRELQFTRLQALLEFAYREVPYYRHLLNEHEILPQRVQTPEDFARIPCLTRETIRRYFDELQPRVRPRRVQRLSSGGSTGSPVTVLVDRERAAFTDATRLRAHRWYGVDMGVPEIVLWGSPIELTKQDVLRTVRDRLLNSWLLSAFDLSESALARYASIIAHRRPQKLYGYASALYVLARYLHRVNWRAARDWPRAVFATAEPLYDFQRATIESVFGCPVATEYGSRDAGLTAHECPAGGLHIAAEGMVVEILTAPDGGPFEPDGAPRGELVVSNLTSSAMPLLRYRTGDIGSLEAVPCRCGRGLPRLGRVEGRQTDFLITPGGRVMHALAVIYVLREIPGISEFQVLQDSVEHLSVKVVPSADFSERHRDAIASGLTRLFDNTVAIDVELTETIASLPSGKHRYVISQVADQYLESVLDGGGERRP